MDESELDELNERVAKLQGHKTRRAESTHFGDGHRIFPGRTIEGEYSGFTREWVGVGKPVIVDDLGGIREVTDYARDWRAAGELFEEMRAAGLWVLCGADPADNGQLFCSVQVDPKTDVDDIVEYYQMGATGPEVITRCWLAWKETARG